MAGLQEEVQQFLDEANLAVFVTLMKDGSPQATPVWVDHDGANVVVNTVQGHQKERNIERDPRVALCIVDRSQAGRWAQVRGRIVSMTRGDEALQHINKLSQKYSGRDYRLRDGEERVKVVIAPEHVTFRPGRGDGPGGAGGWAGGQGEARSGRAWRG